MTARRRIIVSKQLPRFECDDPVIQDFINREIGRHVAEVYDTFQSLLRTPQFIAPALLNSWVNFGAGWASAGFYKDPFGRVHLRGFIKNGTINSTLFVLPDDCWPSENLVFAAIGQEALANTINRITVDTSGNVTQDESVSNDWLSLNGISFAAV